jgi:alkylation response protein AidB-like acyl-CoA dehydrogenase
VDDRIMIFVDVAETADMAALRETLRDFFKGATDPSWERLSNELGLAALAVPERYGGVGAGFGEAAVAVAELGRVLSPVPYLPTAVSTQLLTEGASEIAARYLPDLAVGRLVAALCAGELTEANGRISGRADAVMHGAEADLFLVAASDYLYLVDTADARVAPVPTLDQTRSQAAVEFDEAPATQLGISASRAEELMQTLLAIECAAAAEQCLEITVDYLKTRVQFGRPIATFQALKHRCADLAVEVASARATAAAAVRAAAQASPDAALLAPLAKRHCAEVFLHVAGETIQLHGGIGFTWEHPAHRYFKRAKTTQLLHGDPAQLRRVIAERANLTE